METETRTDVGSAPMTGSKPNGEASAAILGAGFGALALGAATVLAEAVPAIKTALTLYAPAGPLSGKTSVAVAVWLLSWAVLHFLWKDKDTDFGAVFTLTLILIAAGVVGTFPIVFEYFTAR